MITLYCRYCKVRFEAEDFEAVAGIQNSQCFIMRTGITHKLVGGNQE